MKTSNIIIIAFATFILAGMLVLFVDSKQHIKTQVANISFKEYALPVFSVVVAEEGSDLHLEQSDSTFIKVEYIKDKKPVPKKMYKVSNDTLYVYGGLRTFVKCPNFNSFIGNKPHWIGINGFEPDSLCLKMVGGRLNFNTEKTRFTIKKDKQKIGTLNILSSDSAYLNIQHLYLEQLTVKSCNSEIDMKCKSKTVSIKLENKAKFFMKDEFEELTILKDTSSVFEVNSY